MTYLNAMEPIIRYTPTRYRKQKPNACVSNAICALLEKLYQLKGFNLHFDENQLDFNLRNDQKDFEGGIKTRDALLWVQEHGVESYKFKEFYSLKPDSQKLYDTLKTRPVLLSIKRYDDYPNGRVKDGFYHIGTNPTGKSHLVCVFGYEDGFLILDSKRPQGMAKISWDLLPLISRVFYNVIL